VALILLLAAAAATAQSDQSGSRPVFTGVPTRIADGDTLTLPGGTRIRFFGIDAPESDQTCKDAQGATYPCGQVATDALRSKIGSSEISCEQRDRDQYGRVVAVCSLPQPDGSSLDLNDWMVRQGNAVAYTRFTDDYVAAEEEARAARRGLWQGEFLLPWDYRRGTGQPVTADSFPGPGSVAPSPGLAAEEAAAAAAGAPAPADALTDAETAGGPGPCLIKGNINRAGAKIYHVPGSPSYDQTQIDESQGERWFCSEEEAVAAGWRPPG
jgi:endonuclease YncB( thermonuclease family)